MRFVLVVADIPSSRHITSTEFEVISERLYKSMASAVNFIFLSAIFLIIYYFCEIL